MDPVSKPRVLLGPGPGEMHPRVAEALASPLLGHLDPLFLMMMSEVRGQLQRLFRTANEATFTISGTGGAGRDACLLNLVEPGDRVLVLSHGYFGGRLEEGAARLGAETVTAESAWGEAPRMEVYLEAIRAFRPAIVAAVHAETSTGVLFRPDEMKALGQAAREAGGLFLVDCVTSFGGVDVDVDGWPADAAFSCSQKGLACPPGLAPVTFGERAVAKMRARRTPVPSFYFDFASIERYWSDAPAYHHTASSSMLYAIRAALGVILDEGLDARFGRLARNTAGLVSGLEALGLSLLVPPSHRMPMVTPVRVPAGVDDAATRRSLLTEDSIEIGAGLGPFAGKIWRIGLMGYSSRPENVELLLEALRRRLGK
jgi:alanine-glyoxylate transaminase/serine-glyoxylate transaminase/serine-pyruvate transaminase